MPWHVSSTGPSCRVQELMAAHMLRRLWTWLCAFLKRRCPTHLRTQETAFQLSSAQLGACVRRRERSSHRGLFPLLRAHVRLPAAGERERLVCCSMDSSRWPWLFTSSVQGANKIPTIRWRTQLVKEAEFLEYPTACPPAPWMGLPPWCSRPTSCRRTCADSRRAGGFHRISLC